MPRKWTPLEYPLSHEQLTNCRNERRFKCSNCPLNGRQLTGNCPPDQLTNIQRRMRCVLFDRDCCLLRSNDFFLYGASRAVCKIRAPRFQYVSAATISVYLAFCERQRRQTFNASVWVRCDNCSVPSPLMILTVYIYRTSISIGSGAWLEL